MKRKFYVFALAVLSIVFGGNILNAGCDLDPDGETGTCVPLYRIEIDPVEKTTELVIVDYYCSSREGTRNCNLRPEE